MSFRFAIMGAGNIALKFCHAVNLLEECEVAAVASKSMKRAEIFGNSKFKIRIFCCFFDSNIIS